jgi:tetratricopeptide (TPR) repeat protein
VLFDYGLFLQDHQRIAEAEAAYRKAIEFKQDFVRPYINLGILLARRNQSAEAEELLRTATTIGSDPGLCAAAYQNLGTLLRLQRRYDESNKAFARAIELAPDSPYHRYFHALSLLDHKDDAGAAAAFRQAIACDPRGHNAASAYHELGVILLNQQQHVEAEKAFRASIDLQPRFAACFNLGQLLFLRQQYAEAEKSWQQAIQLDPNQPGSHARLARLLVQLARYTEAEAAARHALELSPTFGQALRTPELKSALVEALVTLSAALNGQGRFSEAETTCRWAIGLGLLAAELAAEAHAHLAAALLGQKQLMAAELAARKALWFREDSALAHLLLAQTLARIGRLPHALEHGRRAVIRLDMNDPQHSIARQLVADLERVTKLEAELAGAAGGELLARDAAERIELAQACHLYLRRHTLAARLYAEAFSDAATLPADALSRHRYSAACATILSAAGSDTDTTRLPEVERARLRQRARAWLLAELVDRTRFRSGSEAQRAEAREALQLWLKDPDLRSVRDEMEDQLPDAERKEWHRLWSAVATLAGSSPAHRR